MPVCTIVANVKVRRNAAQHSAQHTVVRNVKFMRAWWTCLWASHGARAETDSGKTRLELGGGTRSHRWPQWLSRNVNTLQIHYHHHHIQPSLRCREEGPNIFCKYCYQISTKIMRITLDTVLFPPYQIIQKGCRVPPKCQTEILWILVLPLPWRGAVSAVASITQSHSHMMVMTSFVCLLMVTWTWWHLQPGHLFTSLPIWLHKINDRAVKTKKVSFSAWSDFILRRYNIRKPFSIFGH